MRRGENRFPESVRIEIGVERRSVNPPRVVRRFFGPSSVADRRDARAPTVVVQASRLRGWPT